MASGYQLKIIVLGDSGVGKTCLLNRYVKQEYTQLYRATIGADFLLKEIVLDERHIALQLWDTAGQERFQSLGMAFYRGADACLLVYDITDFSSFEGLSKWRSEFLNQSNPSEPDTFPFVVLGNKCDRELERAVSKERAEEWCAEMNMVHYEVSAKDNVNVEDPFIEVSKLAMTRESKFKTLNKGNIQLDKKSTQQKKKCC